MPKSKRKAKHKKTGRKGRRSSAKKSAKKVKRKSAKRSAAARKAAKTRAAKKHARSLAAKKGARKRKGGHRKAREMAYEPKRKKAKRKGGKKGGKRKHHEDAATLIARNNVKLADLKSRYAEKLAAAKARLAKAEGAEKARLEKAIVKLQDEHRKEVSRLNKKADDAIMRAKRAEMTAAESKRRKGKRRGRKGHKRGRNPIGSGGMREFAAAGAGVLTGIALTILPYRGIRSHKLLTGQGAPLVDAPAQGDVPNLLTGQLPVWSRMKWRGAVAMGVVVLGDIVLPLWIASRIKSADGWKTYFQMWGMTGVTLAGTKVVVDVAALATKSTGVGQRLFAPENTARDVRTQSAAAQLPAIGVAPGAGMPGLAGYGRANEAQPGCAHVGAGAPCCASCAGATGKKADPGNRGVGQEIPGTQPMGAAPGVAPTPEPGTSVPGGSPTHTGAGSPISKFEPRNRFDAKSRFGT